MVADARFTSCFTGILLLNGIIANASRAFHAYDLDVGVEDELLTSATRRTPRRIVSLGGFPFKVGSKSRSFLNGRFIEQAGDAFRINDRETYWSQDNEHFLYHCPKHEDWRVGWRQDWGPKTACACWAFAHTNAKADILDPDGTPFIGISDHSKWHWLEHDVGVVALGMQKHADRINIAPPTWPSGASRECEVKDQRDEGDTVWMDKHRPCYKGVDVNTATFRLLTNVPDIDPQIASAILYGRTCPLKSTSELKARIEAMDEGTSSLIWSRLQPFFETGGKDQLCVGCWGPRGIYRDDDSESSAADVNRASRKRLEAIHGLTSDMISRIFMARTCFYHNAEDMSDRIYKEAPASAAERIWQTIQDKLQTEELCIGKDYD